MSITIQEPTPGRVVYVTFPRRRFGFDDPEGFRAATVAAVFDNGRINAAITKRSERDNAPAFVHTIDHNAEGKTPYGAPTWRYPPRVTETIEVSE